MSQVDLMFEDGGQKGEEGKEDEMADGIMDSMDMNLDTPGKEQRQRLCACGHTKSWTNHDLIRK